MTRIRLSEKHGVNPTIPECFFCGEPKNEVVLLGKLKDDAEAPMHCVLDYEPCDRCKEQMSQGVTLIEVTDRQPVDGRPPIKAKGDIPVYPLGSYAVVKPEAAERVFGMSLTAGQTLFVDSEVFPIIMGGAEND